MKEVFFIYKTSDKKLVGYVPTFEMATELFAKYPEEYSFVQLPTSEIDADMKQLNVEEF